MRLHQPSEKHPTSSSLFSRPRRNEVQNAVSDLVPCFVFLGVLDIELQKIFVDEVERRVRQLLLERLGGIARIDEFITLREDLRLEGAEIERQGILHVGENARRVENAIGIGNIRLQSEQLAHALPEAGLAEQGLLRADCRKPKLRVPASDFTRSIGLARRRGT